MRYSSILIIFAIMVFLLINFLLINYVNAQEKIKICHFTNSEKNPYVVIEVDINSLKAHLGHGDLIYDNNQGCIQEGPMPQ